MLHLHAWRLSSNLHVTYGSCMGLFGSWFFVAVSLRAAYTNIAGPVSVIGALRLSILSLIPRFPSWQVFFSFSEERSICLCWLSTVIARPYLPCLNFVCQTFLPILFYEISSVCFNLSVFAPVGPLSWDVFVAPSLSHYPPNLFAWLRLKLCYCSP